MRQAPSSPKPAAVPEFFSPHVGKARRFYLDLDPPRRRSLTVVCGGLEYCAPDYTICRNTFPYYCIEYVLRGKGEVTLGRHTHALGAGHLFSYGPKVKHKIGTNSGDPLVKYFVDFVGSQAAELLTSCRLAVGDVARVFPADSLAPLFDELIQSGTHAVAGSTDFCAKLLECIALKAAARTAPAKSGESRAFASYQHCRVHIELHFVRLHTLEQLAAECGLNSAYLCRLFTRFDHQSPYQYLLRLKMNHAAMLLQQPGALVKDAAAAVGFGDTFHFSRVFHNVLGTSPAEFRRLR